MRRVARLIGLVTLAVLSLPSHAWAAARVAEANNGVHLAVSLLGLAISVVLLVQALGLRKLAMGGVIANGMSMVVLAVICLVASALGKWGANFVTDLTLDQIELAAELLVIAAMGLLAAYFYTVHAGMRRFITEVSTTAPVTDGGSAPQNDQDELG